MAPSSCSLAQRMLSHCSLIRFLCVRKTYAVIHLELCLFEKENSIFYGYCTADYSLFCSGIWSSVPLYDFPSSGALVFKYRSALKFSRPLNMCSRGTLLASLNTFIVFSYCFSSCTPNLS